MMIFEKTYDDESLVDLDRDVSEAIIDEFNPAVAQIPQDEHGFKLGSFKVTIEWIPPE